MNVIAQEPYSEVRDKCGATSMRAVVAVKTNDSRTRPSNRARARCLRALPLIECLVRTGRFYFAAAD